MQELKQRVREHWQREPCGSRDIATTDRELAVGEQRQDRSLESNHRADECVDEDEQRELAPVRAEAELGP